MKSPFGMATTTPMIDAALLRGPHIPKRRDAHAFYWLKTPHRNHVERWQLECDEFRHRMEPEIFDIGLTGHVNNNQPRRGALRVTLFARNLRHPFEKVFPIRLDRVDANSIKLIRDLLP
jgi:hypothetical protein